MQTNTIYFNTFLQTAFENGSYATDDVIAFVLPLFEEVLTFHEAGLVAPFYTNNSLFITNNCIDIDETKAHAPLQNNIALKALFAHITSKQFTITGKTNIETDVDNGITKTTNTQIHLGNTELLHPAYIKGYQSFEQLVQHHDVQTDIFCLGLILGSIAMGLNLNNEDDLEHFVEYRQNPVYFNNRIHPTIAALITNMTELNRKSRTQDLYEVIHQLQHYRDYDPEKQQDLSNIPGWVNKPLKERSQFILNKLKNRLFDNSRRNRLLYYKSNLRFVNLTVSSVPMVLHYQSIKPDLLFTWNSEISNKVIGAKEIILNKYLRFEDHHYLPGALDKIRVESQRDVQEYGCSQLKLVITFLNWHNLKEDAAERIQSPLLLVPVELKKTKRLKEDHYNMKVLDNVAEVNPVVANQLRELYGIKLPDFIDLDEITIPQFYQLLKTQIDNANQGIQLQYVDKPKIKLVHSIAKQTVGTYNRRLHKKENKLDSYKNIAYSYQHDNYKPLGLEIFKQRIENKATFLEFLINDDITLSSNQLTASNTKQRELYQLTESEHNPYSWDFDVCNMVLGNFNYKKMSLVTDYNYIIDNQIQHQVFENLFSNLPKQQTTHTVDLNKVQDWHHVITADPAQTKAILQGRTGQSYIIQGPPGTGKSQTITNLIADYVARGKNILFVCEKRAALDVVFHRLKQSGLDELCCYIHDSQTDKRTFIKNLKSTYEDFIQHKMDLVGLQIKQSAILQNLQEQIKLLDAFHQLHNAAPANVGMPVKKLIDKIIQLQQFSTELQPQQVELLPNYSEWAQFGETIESLSKALEETGADAAFAEHPLSKLNDGVFTADNPLNLIDNLTTSSKNLLAEIDGLLTTNQVLPEHSNQLQQIKSLVQDAVLLHPLAEHNNIDLVNANNKSAKEFDKKIKQYRQQQQQVEKATKQNSNWINKPSEQDVQRALEIAQKNESSFFSFLNSSWRNLKKQLHSSYNFAQHQVKPSYSSILQQLQAEYNAFNTAEETKQQLKQAYQFDNFETAYSGIELLRAKQGDAEIDYLLAHPQANELIKKLYKLNNTFYQLETQLHQLLQNTSEKSIATIQEEIDNIVVNQAALLELLPALKNFHQLPDSVKACLRNLPLSPIQAEAAIANKTLQQVYQQNKLAANTDIVAIDNAVSQIQKCYKQLLQLNAALIRANIRKNFLHHIEVSNTALSQLSADQKTFKKNYNEGRKILENEFGKSMRYKSIRELSAKESGLVLKDIKPIWLMSPLSVSDCLPLDTHYFDVVIFDEASQITLEEGVPALYRSNQTIIVGDDKQMPPTNFFTTKAEDPDDLISNNDELEDELLSADADSLLAQGARKLDSTMLSWHYRSHYETLISYSNHAFYEAGLLTIPDKTIHQKEKSVISITKPQDAETFVDCLFDRSISFHHHPESLYEKRNNKDEANYIAHLVKTLLQKKVRESIGIVAFSQEQQHTIEDALSELALTDKVFEQQLEEAYNRTEDDQFVGLIVKNLENIQGDERDIIIMSVCYGFDSRKKLLMNFGPINKKGGEKRLNVIFSRAKKHMAIISSIQHQHITNEYNEGANYFKRFLHYAQSVSNGNMQTARTILDGLVIQKKDSQAIAPTANIVLQQVQQQLTTAGYETMANVGQSDFKCSLAVKLQPNDEAYSISILIDDDKHYNNCNLVEQYYQRPAILQAFGWRTIRVFAKDWLQNPTRAMEQLLKKMKEAPIDTETIIEEETGLLTNSFSDQPLPLTAQDGPKLFIQEPITFNTIPGFENIQFTRLECKDANSNKFWEVATQQNKLIVRYGRIDSKGQVQIKSFDTAEKALAEMEKQLQEKREKGYQ